jgi:hypothetical protein
MKKSFYINMILSFYIVSCDSSTKYKRENTKRNNFVLDQGQVKTNTIDTLAYTITIKKYCDSIDKNLSDLKVRKQDVFGGSAEGGYIYLYKAKTDTLRLKAVYYGETGKSEYNIYLRNKMMILFKEKSTYYVSPLGEGSVRIDSIILKNYILKDNKILIGENNKMKIATENYEQISRDIRELYKEILDQLDR